VLSPNTSAFENAAQPSSGAGGIYMLDRIDLFNLLCVPGETTTSVLSSLETFCRKRRAFLIADSAADATLTSLQNGPDSSLTGNDAINAAFYFPWVTAPDPLQENRPTDFPPCGFVAGLYARTDSTRGVWKAPAGTDASLTGVTGVKTMLTNDENGVLNPKAVNCIRNFPTYGTIIWGARTLQGNDERGSEWKYVPVRRTALFLEESLYRALKWVVFEPNDEPLWAQIRLNVGAFLHDLFRQGAFQGKTPQDAYFVKCDKETTTQNDINLGIVNIVVGFAPLKPAEFVVIQIQQIAGQIQT
jgi:phage tail sheath protein FI